MIILTNASKYSINGGTEMAFQIDYTDGTSVRAVIALNGTIRKEYKNNGTWMQAGKPYKIKHNKKRHAEQIKETVNEFLGN